MIIMDHHISILMRQTNYTKEECTELLKTYSLEECIIQYLQIKKKKNPRKQLIKLFSRLYVIFSKKTFSLMDVVFF